MADIGMRGSHASQDTRFKDKEAASIKATKFPKHFNEKVDLRKVNLSVLRGWIAQKVTELIRVEDDVVVEYVYGMLEDKENPIPDPKKMQVSLIGFMDKYGAAAFMEELWKLLLSAQSTVGGVPAEFIAAKKAELEQKQINERDSQNATIGSDQNRPQASDSFDRTRDGGNGLPPRPGGPGGPREHDYRRGPPPSRRFDDRDRGGREFKRERDDGYGPRGGRGGHGGHGGRGGRGHGDQGYGRQGNRSPGRGYGYRRRSPSPRRRSPSPPPRRRRSPSPRRERSITPPLRTTGHHDAPRRTPSPSPSPPPRRRAGPPPQPSRGRSQSRTPTPSDRSMSRSRSRSRSPTVTPPRHGRRSSTPPARTRGSPRRDRGRDTPPSPPPRRRARADSRSPRPKRRRPSVSPPRDARDPGDDVEGVVKKGRGRFTVEEGKESQGKLEGPLSKSKWAD